MDPTCVFNFFTFFERILYKYNCIIFIFSWCATHTKIRSKLVVIVTAGARKNHPQRTPLGILRVIHVPEDVICVSWFGIQVHAKWKCVRIVTWLSESWWRPTMLLSLSWSGNRVEKWAFLYSHIFLVRIAPRLWTCGLLVGDCVLQAVFFVVFPDSHRWQISARP